MEKFYFDKLGLIGTHADKLKSYLQVLKVYAEYEMDDNEKIGNIYEILELAEIEIDNIIHNL